MQLQYDKKKLSEVCEQNSIRYLGLFGSYARNTADKDSDIDLVVDFIETPSLLGHIRLENTLSESLFGNTKVDLVTERSLNRYIRPHVMNSLVTLYERK